MFALSESAQTMHPGCRSHPLMFLSEQHRTACLSVAGAQPAVRFHVAQDILALPQLTYTACACSH